jgi:hypothetical protein
MSSNGGGGSNLLDMGLMIAAGVAAPELAPVIFGEGLTGAAAVGATAATGAALSGATAAATGQNVGRGALTGALGGALSGAMAPGLEAPAGATPGGSLDVAGSQAGTDALRASGNLPVGTPMEGGTLGSLTPQQLSQNVANGTMTQAQADLYGQAYTNSFDGIKSIGGMQAFNATNPQLYASGIAGATGAMGAKPNVAYSPPPYKGGALQKFHYDPNNYQPDVVVPPSPVYQAHYAQGGIAQLPQTQDKNFAAGDMYPGSQIDKTQYSSSPQTPISMQSTLASYDPETNPLTGEPTTHMASGGIAQLSAGGKLLKGPGDGMSDSINANINGKQQARLADGEFVIPADVVSHLGNGSTDAGAKHLYKMMNNVRKARTGNPKQGKQINSEKYLPA